MPACVSQLQSEKLISEAEHREFSSLSKSQESIWRIYAALLEMHAVRPLGQLAQWLTYCQLICVNVQAFLNPRTDLLSAVTSIWSNSMEESWSFASRGEVQWCLPQALTWTVVCIGNGYSFYCQTKHPGSKLLGLGNICMSENMALSRKSSSISGLK